VSGLAPVFHTNHRTADLKVGSPNCQARLGGDIRLVAQQNHCGIGSIGGRTETRLQRGALPCGEPRIQGDSSDGREPQRFANLARRVSQDHHYLIELRFPEDVYDVLEQGLSPIREELFAASHSG